MYDPEFPLVMLVFETLSCLPPTSVSCETTFSQMKLIKTSRRTRLRNTTLNNLLLIKLESPNVADYTPDKAVEKWMVLIFIFFFTLVISISMLNNVI